jgi:glyoxylase-like metal-dependent hydrolase (beta-lactamase superfamily II)
LLLPCGSGSAYPRAPPENELVRALTAGLPGSWQSLATALGRLGRAHSDIEAVVVTHGHFDHLGFAERARRELSVPIHVHENDVPLTRHPWRYDHERSRAYYFATQVRALPMVAAFVRRRAWWPPPVAEVQRFSDGVLRVPGSPESSSRPATPTAIARCTSPTEMP